MKLNFDVGSQNVEWLINQASQFTVGDILRKNARVKREGVGIVFEGREWTFAELNQEVNKLANSLSQLGIDRGDRVAILSENRIEYSEIFYAAAKLGFIVPAFNLRFSERELRESILLTTPETILVSAEHFARLKGILEDLHFVKRIILLDRIKDAVLSRKISIHLYEDLVASGSPAEVNRAVLMEDAFIILYTSGTAGVSKGAIISHRAMIARAMLFAVILGVTENDTDIVWSPMYHMGAANHILATHTTGGKVILLKRYDAGEIVALLEKEPIRRLPMMPGAIESFIAELKKKRPLNIKGVKSVGAMADLVPSSQIAELTSLIGAAYLNTFGSTETGLAPATGNFIPIDITPSSLSKKESYSCEIRLVDENDNDVPIGEPGELIMRGPTLFSGYWNDPETNEKDFQGGWFHTGDVLRRNPDGTLAYVDRRKYMIKSGGENIYPAEIERVLMDYPGVQEAVVVRIKDQKWSEVPKAYVACQKGVTKSKLMEYCLQHLARYKIPKDIEFVSIDKFPRSTTGKVIRSEVEKWG
jgi:fatty-acyl-CoA synthase